MFLLTFFSVEMTIWLPSEYPLMYPQKVLQGIPDLKRTAELFVLYFLIVPQGQAQSIRYGLLGQPGGFSCSAQIFPRHADSLLAFL